MSDIFQENNNILLKIKNNPSKFLLMKKSLMKERLFQQLSIK